MFTPDLFRDVVTFLEGPGSEGLGTSSSQSVILKILFFILPKRLVRHNSRRSAEAHGVRPPCSRISVFSCGKVTSSFVCKIQVTMGHTARKKLAALVSYLFTVH